MLKWESLGIRQTVWCGLAFLALLLWQLFLFLKLCDDSRAVNVFERYNVDVRAVLADIRSLEWNVAASVPELPQRQLLAVQLSKTWLEDRNQLRYWAEVGGEIDPSVDVGPFSKAADKLASIYSKQLMNGVVGSNVEIEKIRAEMLKASSVLLDSLADATVSATERTEDDRLGIIAAFAGQILLVSACVVLFKVRAQDRVSIQRTSNGLHQETQQLKLLINDATDVVCILDGDSRFEWVSESCSVAWGYSPEELKGHSLSEFLVSGDKDAGVSQFINAESAVSRLTFENFLRRKDGQQARLLWTTNWSSSHNQLFCVVHDITERQHAEDLIRKSEENLRNVLETLPVAVLIMSPEYLVEFSNAEARRLLGVLVGNSLHQSIATNNLHPLIEQSKCKPVEATFLDGSSRIVVELFTTAMIYGDSEKLLVSAVDITRRSEFDRLKREFMAMVTHDLRSPVTMLEGVLTMIAEGRFGSLDETGTNLVDRGCRESARMVELINNLLDFERLDAGEFRMEPRSVSILKIIDQALEGVRLQAEDKGVTVVADVNNDIDVFADRNRIVQVLINLISNAVRFSPENTQVSVGVDEVDESVVRVMVTDAGPGISEENRALIFEKFKQLKNNSGGRQGAGLGLAICRGIIEKHSGNIGVESGEGGGSCFWFTLPRKAPLTAERSNL